MQLPPAPPAFARDTGAGEGCRAEARSAKAGLADSGLRLGKPAMFCSTPVQMNFHYVHILQSVPMPDRFYVGLSDDLRERLSKHNAGGVPHTSKFRPWGIKTAIAFRDRERASAFERYLKSGSGRAFVKRHF